MAFYYFDASALVKYYVTEPGSNWVRQLIEERDPGTNQISHVILVAEITTILLSPLPKPRGFLLITPSITLHLKIRPAAPPDQASTEENQLASLPLRP